MLTSLANGAAALVAAASVVAQDTATVRVHGHGEVLDSTVDHTLLPDTVTPIIQWIFQKPPWVMWGGVILAAILGLVALWWLRGHIKQVLAVPGLPQRHREAGARRRRRSWSCWASSGPG